MRIHAVWAVRLVSIGILGAVACSAPDPGVGVVGSHNNNALGGSGGTSNNNTNGTNGGNNNNNGGSNAVDSGSGNVETDAGSGGSNDAGSGGGADAGASDAGGPVTAFSSAGPYASSPVQAGDNAATKHTVAAQGFTNPAGRDCMTCHSAAGPATQFAFAGTAYTSAAGTTPAADVEVRVVDSAGKEQGSAHSDSDGNFWVPSTTALPSTAITGARNATTTVKMISNATAPCNTCHAAGGAAGSVIHVP